MGLADCTDTCGNPQWKDDDHCDDANNNCGCDWDGGDCCGPDVNTDYCTECECLDPSAEYTTTTNSPSNISSYSPNNISCNDEGTLKVASCNLCPYELYIFAHDYNDNDYDQENFEQNPMLQQLYCKGNCSWDSHEKKCQEKNGTMQALETC